MQEKTDTLIKLIIAVISAFDTDRRIMRKILDKSILIFRFSLAKIRNKLYNIKLQGELFKIIPPCEK